MAATAVLAYHYTDRDWSAVVVREGTRCWFGNQFSLIAPRFAAYGVDLWVRKMLAATIRDTIYYRCLARTIAPGSPVLADHPRTVNVREDQVIDPLNEWIMQVYEPRPSSTTPRNGSAVTGQPSRPA